MNRPKEERVTDAELIEAFEESGGIIAAAIVYIREHFNKEIHRETVTDRIRKSDEVRAARDNGLEACKDLAESRLFEAIEAGNMTAIIFFLKTRGKERGYTERQEIQAAAEVRMINPYDGMSREELRELLKKELPKETPQTYS